MDLSIIIVNWNTRDLLDACLASVYASTGDLQLEVFVVDNASGDGSAAMVRTRYPHVRLIKNSENRGFAAANNQALALASGRYILLLNPDTIVLPEAILMLVHALDRQPRAAIAGAQLLNADDSLQLSTGVYPSLWSELPVLNRHLRAVHCIHTITTPVGVVTAQSVDWVSGACLMIRRNVINEIGVLDEAFWLYTEETDWCYRTHTAGWDVLSVPQARVYHLARAASGQRYVFTMLCFYQSRVRFALKHYGHLHAAALKLVLWLKAAIWRWRPSNSPLRGAYPSLSDKQIRSAYLALCTRSALPLRTYLERSCQ